MGRAFALVAALLVPSLTVVAPHATAGLHIIPVKAFLCDSAAHAIQFADVIAKGEGEEMARDRVGRAAQAEVCGRYAGMAIIESQHVTLDKGTAYKVTAYRFREDDRVAWLAERTFAPTSTQWDL